MEQQLVIFKLATEYFGIDIATVESIVKLQPVTVIPHTPDYIIGVTNLRGTILPVIELHKRFGLGEQDEVNKENRIIVVTVDGQRAGMIVDAVSEVIIVDESAIEPPPGMISGIDSAFITGIAKLEDRLVILLDLAQILTLHETAEPVRMGR